MTKIDDIRQWAERNRRNHAKAVEGVIEERSRVEAARERVDDCERAQVIIQQVAQRVQQQAHAKIASVVSRCLKAVFGDEAYEFNIAFERKRGRTEARIAFMRAGNEVDPSLGTEGGVIDVAAFALRLACLVLTKPPVRKLLVLDEPFKNVNGELYRGRVREMMETLPQELGVQVIMSTGYEWLQVGKVVRV